MNGSVVMAKTAGMESTAKIRSVVSTSTSTTKRGVATRRRRSPTCSRMKKLCPWYWLVTGTKRLTSRITGLLSGSMSISSCVAIRMPVNTRKAPKT